MNRADRRRMARALDAVYRQVPSIDCKGDCHDNCTVLAMAEGERDRLLALGVDPTLVAGRCGALTPAGRCGAYEARPLICRLFGVAEGLPCPHGCTPRTVLPRERVRQLIAEVARIAGPTTVNLGPGDSLVQASRLTAPRAEAAADELQRAAAARLRRRALS